MSRLQPHHARHHAAVHLAADPGNGAIADGGLVGDQDVAGGGAYHLHQGIVASPGPHRPHVAVKGAAGDHHLAGEVQPFRPLGGQGADRQIGGPAVGKERVVEILGQQRIKGVEKVGGRQAAPARVPEGLVAGGAAPALEVRRGLGAAQDGGHPVTQLDPVAGGGAHCRIGSGDVQYLGPEPLGGVDAANVAAVVGELAAVTQGRDGLGLLDGGVILPQHEHGVGVVGKLRAQGQHLPFLIDGGRGGAGAVHPDAAHCGSLGRGELTHHSHHRLLHGLQIVEGVVAELVVDRLAVVACLPAGVIDDLGRQLGAVLAAHGECPDRVAAEIESDDDVLRHMCS
ncbi:hypothetical protein D3C72_1021410 [compost metagenome]